MKILLVDDQQLDRMMFGGRLEKLGHEVIFATSGEEAIKRAMEDHPDLVILDSQMPGMDGVVALEKISTFSKRPRLWFHSGIMDDDLAKKARACGAENAFPKERFKDEILKLS